MMLENQTVPILQTKLHRPPVADDVVIREELFERLESGLNLPLTLVSAPAGYGKSSLVSQWLKTHQHSHCWLSLEQSESDFWTFLSYIANSFRSLVPTAFEGTLQLMASQPMPALHTLAASFANELVDIEERLILVLDDFHLLTGNEVIEVLDTLLEHPPRNLHLVIISRRDPALQIRMLRARRMMNEFRANDLRLQADEAGDFIRRVSGVNVSLHNLSRIYRGTEGWPVGLRLAGLAIRYANSDEIYESFEGDSHAVQEYLLEEILSGLEPDIRDCLRKASILDRFCGPLCEALLKSAEEDSGWGQAFIGRLQSSGLLLVSLDERDYWFRFHHLFRDLLQDELASNCDRPEIDELHRKAAAWLEQNGLVEEAVSHLLAIGRESEAAEIIKRFRQVILENEQWARLSKLLNSLKQETIITDPELLLLCAWVENSRANNEGILEAVQAAEKLVGDDLHGEAPTGAWRAEMELFRSWPTYCEGDVEQALKLSEIALSRLTPDQKWIRGYTQFMTTLYLQALGRTTEAQKVVRQALSELGTVNQRAKGRLLYSKFMVEWLAGDLNSVILSAQVAIDFSEKHRIPDTAENATGVLGAALYQLNRLEEADQVLARLTSKSTYVNEFAHQRAVIAHGLTLLAMGRTEQALQLLDEKNSAIMESANSDFQTTMASLKALIALRGSKMAEAVRWAETFEAAPLLDAETVLSPGHLAAEIHIASGRPELLERAGKLLESHLSFYRRTNRCLYQIEALVLLSLLADAGGDEGTAHQHLFEAIELARPGRFVRVFADRGEQVIPLLNQLELDEDGLMFVGQIMSASLAGTEEGDAREQPGRAAYTDATHAEVLTRRENQILGLIAQHMSNRQIADQLFIAPGTVRRHTENIFQKLGVHKRMDAVTKAKGLGIL